VTVRSSRRRSRRRAVAALRGTYERFDAMGLLPSSFASKGRLFRMKTFLLRQPTNPRPPFTTRLLPTWSNRHALACRCRLT
jgi:hypothetical protein